MTWLFTSPTTCTVGPWAWAAMPCCRPATHAAWNRALDFDLVVQPATITSASNEQTIHFFIAPINLTARRDLLQHLDAMWNRPHHESQTFHRAARLARQTNDQRLVH